jgi:hypothetical protein
MIETAPPGRLMNTTDAAAWLGFSPRTLMKWRVKGGGPIYSKLRGHAVRYKLEDLEVFAGLDVRTHTRGYP